MTLAIRSAPPTERGAVVGTFTAFFDAAFGIGAIAAGTLADAVGYRGSFIGAAVVALFGLGLTFGYARGTRKEENRIDPEPAATR
jgi:predicted MFS family arabinose efflux permease